MFFFSFVVVGRAQVKQFDLTAGNCQRFGGHLYSFGISSQNQRTALCVYKLDLKLNLLDSFVVAAGKSAAGNYLQSYADTLHDLLNIYFQEKEKKGITILRFARNFNHVATVTNVDPARLNNTAMFSSESLYFRNNVYSIKTETDTSGKQFYLNKYTLKSETTNFDYEFKWQFPFERKNIHAAHIFYAGKDHVLLFVMVYGGSKTGQWVLKIDAETGRLIKATRLNEKGETDTYLFGTSFFDRPYKSIYLAGQKFTEIQIGALSGKTGATTPSVSVLYALEIDSLGEIAARNYARLPVNDIKTMKPGARRGPASYILRLNALSKNPDGGLVFNTDIFKRYGSEACYYYANTTVFRLVPSEDKLVTEKNSVSPNPLIEDFYTSTDKLDMNGKLCSDSLGQFETTFYRPLTFPVKQQFKYDNEQNPVWLLGKHTTKKNTVNFSFLKPVKKIYQLITLEEITETYNPMLTGLNAESFLISSQTPEGKYQLKLYNW